MTDEDRTHILRLREEIGCPLTVTRGLYMAHKDVGLDTVIVKLEEERHKIFNELVNNEKKEIDKSIIFVKQEDSFVKIIKIKMQTDFLVRTKEMRVLIDLIFNEDPKAKVTYERLVVFASERMTYEYKKFSYSGHVTLSVQRDKMWDDLVIPGSLIAKNVFILNHENEGQANMVSSKIADYVRVNQGKIDLSHEEIEKIFGNKIEEYTKLNVTQCNFVDIDTKF